MKIFNDNSAYREGLIRELLELSYRDIDSTNDNDRDSFTSFDKDVAEHLDWVGKYVFITSIDSVPVGFVSFDPRQKPTAIIGHNCVVPEHRGKGIGAEQMREVLLRIKQQGFEKAVVSTGVEAAFELARRMYDACGFVKTGIIQDEKTGKEMVEYELELTK